MDKAGLVPSCNINKNTLIILQNNIPFSIIFFICDTRTNSIIISRVNATKASSSKKKHLR